MKTASSFVVVLVTAPDLQVARALAQGALRQKLAACANLLPKMESHYWWQGRLETSSEVLLLFKTRRTRLTALEKFVLANHPYDTPEVVSLKLDGGTARYLKWLGASVE